MTSSSSSSSSSLQDIDKLPVVIPLAGHEKPAPKKSISVDLTAAVKGYLGLHFAEFKASLHSRFFLQAACLPADESNQASRDLQLQRARDTYRWNFDFFSLPFIDGLPDTERPKVAFVKGLLSVLADLFRNSLELTQTPKNKKIIIAHARRAFRQIWSVNQNTIVGLSDDLGVQVRKVLVDGVSTDSAQSILDFSCHFTHHIGHPQVLRQVFPHLLEEKANATGDTGDRYMSDSQFAWYRVAGPNPMLICEATEDRMQNFAVTDAMLQSLPAFRGDSLQTAREDNRLYMIDYSFLESVPMREGRYHYAPKALFCVPKDESPMLPVAIQCGPDPAKYPVYTPRSSQINWIAAKTMVQVSDATAHESIFHLGRCHMTMEPIVCASHRCLAAKHPLLRLLAEHFTGTALINFAGTIALISVEGTADRILSPPVDDLNKVVAKTVAAADLTAWMPKNDFKERGVESKKLVYPYRDDAIALWDVLEGWVEGYLRSYYYNNSAVVEDHELQDWTRELSGTGGLGGIGRNGKLATIRELVALVTMIIYTASVQHSAVNFPQWSTIGFTPLMPVSGYIPAPTFDAPFPWDERDITESEQYCMYLSQMLPPLDAARSQVFVMKLLASLRFTRLGSYPARSLELSRPERLNSINRLQGELELLESKILERNTVEKAKGLLPYTYLLPSLIPASTNI